MKKYLAQLRQWLSNDPGKPLDVLDYKAKEAFASFIILNLLRNFSRICINLKF
jgi:hypothetical protein